MTDKAKELLEDLKTLTNKILLDLVAENEELEEQLENRGEPCNDYIIRKDAIQALKAEGLEELCKSLGVYPWNVIKMIPSVQPIRPKGEWIDSDIPNEKYVCSNCGGACWYYDYEGDVAKSNFCPNCGADMRGE